MAKPHRSDDLFAKSTMTFGEHLEELRGTLFRALTGLVIGFLIGLTLATHVVELIKSPLSKALAEYHLTTALEKLDERFQGDPPPEMLTLIQEEGLIPEAILVEPFGFLRKLGNDYPEQFGSTQVAFSDLINDDLSTKNVRGLCAAWTAGFETEGSATKELWNVLSEEHQQTIRRLASETEIGQPQRQVVINILNDLVKRRSLHEGDSFATLIKAVSDDRTKESIEALQSQLQQQFEEGESRRLNRLLVASVFSDHMRRPRYNLVELVTWKPAEVAVQSLGVHEGFMIWIKAALISGIVFASPWIFYEIWNFVAAGLYSHEKRFVHVFLPFSLLLFFAGASLAFFFVFEPVLDFLFSFNRRMNIEAAPRISEWLNFVLFLPLGFGISFQLPLVMLFLNRIGVFTVSSYLSKWRIAVLVIFVLSMLLTPADPVSMLLMAVPLTVLYFGGVALCHWLPRRSSPVGEGYDA